MLRVNCVDYLLKKFFYRLGIIVAKYPGYFLLIPVFITLICVTGLQRVHYVTDSEYLFSPEQGPSKTERSLIEFFFKVNYSHRFNPTRITRPGKHISSLLHNGARNFSCRLSFMSLQLVCPKKHEKVNQP